MSDNFAQTADETGVLPKASTFSRIRRSLDSQHSYLIFENTAPEGTVGDFKKICNALDAPGAGVLERIFYRDNDTGRLLLVARLGPDSDRLWKERMLTEALPGGINFYFYGRVR